MTTICGIIDKIFWVCEFDEYTAITTHRCTAFGVGGEFTPETQSLVERFGPPKYFGTPMQAIHEIKQSEDINAFLTDDKQAELLALFKK